jgi:tetratricopeptide (TPR) repeat protein
VFPTLLALGGARGEALPDDVGCGRDLFAGKSPADRARVAEGQHAWHQFRWAQLSCAVVSGRRLEDRGAGRERRWKVGPDGSLEELSGPVGGDAADRAVVEALRAYRKGEQRPVAGGDAPGGYGAGGGVGPLLEPAENARRPDPYEVISDAYRIGQVAEVLSSDAASADPNRVRAASDALSRLAGRDPGNPAIAFWRGQALRRLGRWETAVLAFREALDLGRVDVETVLLLSDSVALSGRGPEALEALRTGARRVPPSTRLFVLEARLLKDLGKPSEEVAAACRKASEAVRTKRDRALVDRSCP